ncbi:MAG TPA: DUF4232 domain-containing protein [Gaiellaceae bacterium]|nr:DUF4232 domain-containing protein [Gaiellaceae bacterium]
MTVTHVRTVTTTRTVTTRAVPPASPCLAVDLAGTFAVVPGSAGAGQIEYVLTLKNTSHRRCSLSGLPRATLLGATGAPLPTRVTPAVQVTRAPVVLEPGASAVAHARFSPDVAGPGDSQTGACQPVAHTLQVTPNGGGATDAPIEPPTSVCERGTLQFDAYGYAG